MNPIPPTQKQIHNSCLSGWEYLGDSLFCRDDIIGYFTEEGWHCDW